MKKKLYLILCLSMMAFLSGCKGYIDLESRNFVMGLGLDEEDGKLVVTYSFPDLGALTGNGQDLKYPVTAVVCESIEDGEKILAEASNKVLDYGQLQTIVIGSELLSDKAMLDSVMEELKEQKAFSRNVGVCAASEDARSIIEMDETVNGSIGIYIRDMTENNFKSLGLPITTLGDLFVARSQTSEMVNLNVLKKDNDIPILNGLTEIDFGNTP